MFGEVSDPLQAGVGPDHRPPPAVHRTTRRRAPIPKRSLNERGQFADRHAVAHRNRIEPDERFERRLEHRAFDVVAADRIGAVEHPKLFTVVFCALAWRKPSSRCTCTRASRRLGCRRAARRRRQASPRVGWRSRRRGCRPADRVCGSTYDATSAPAGRSPRKPCSGA